MKKPELLAPAGSMQSLVAAINAGCDAIYLSGVKYGARAYANNFDNNELIEAIKYSHLYGVKVYITVNTLIFENEVEQFMKYIDFLYKNNADALIIQDIGMMDLIRKTYPNFELHASTQMHIHNIEGIKLLEKLNIKRAVLARETTIQDIEQIKKNSYLEIEIFVHGALCISYSGQCLMSYLIGGRSGNRGACAGSCRLPYDLISNDRKVNEDSYPLSMKDLNTLMNLDQLINMNIDSIKIEGRMKKPEYVFLVVSLYRKAIDSYVDTGKINITNEDIKDLKKIFNRQFTKGFIFKEDNKNIVNEKRSNHQGIEIGKVIDYKNNHAIIKLTDNLNINDGIRFLNKNDTGFILTSMFKNKERITNAFCGDIINIKVSEQILKDTTLLKTLDNNLIKEINEKIKNNKRIKINCNVVAHTNEKLAISYSDDSNTVSICGNVIAKSINSPITQETIKIQLSKLGQTAYELDQINIESDQNIFINIKELNELRRQLVLKLNEKRIYNREYLINNYKINVPNLKQKEEFNLEVDTLEQYNRLNKYFNRIYSKNQISNTFLKLPRVITNYDSYGEPLLVSELGSINKYSNIETDFSLNVVNSYSVAFLHSLGVKKVTLSYEIDEQKTKELYDAYVDRYKTEPNIEVIVASRKEAMISKFNLNYKYQIMDSYLKDRLDKKYPIKEFNGLMYIYDNKYEIRNLDLKINKRVIINFDYDITDNLIKFIKGNI